MIKNCYFKCDICGSIKCIYMDDEFVYNITKFQTCSFDEGSLTYVENYIPEVANLEVKAKVQDGRKMQKHKYKDQIYKDKVDAIKHTYLKGAK